MPSHVDEDGRATWTRILYVIELKKKACADPRSPCKGTRCGRTPVYVGETGCTALERFEQHKAGYRASRWVWKYGLRLRPRLFGGFGEIATNGESKAAEAELARRLRKRGKGNTYCVYGGH